MRPVRLLLCLVGYCVVVWCSSPLAYGNTPDNPTDAAPGFCRHDVGATSIRWPRDTVALDTVSNPRAWIYNFGDITETGFPVTFFIFTGADTLYRATDTFRAQLTPGTTATMVFPQWTARPTGQYTAVCYTKLVGDVSRANDTTRRSFLIQDCCGDVGATLILAPTGTVDSGALIPPRAVIRNYTGRAETFPVTLRIGSLYTQTQQCSLAGFAIDTVEFAPDWTAEPPGSYPVICFTALAADADRSNDTARSSVTVLDCPRHDVGALEIVWPRGPIDSGSVVTPRAVIRNYGNRDETFPVTLRIGIVYSRTVTASLAVGATDTISFPAWTAHPLGGHTTVCFTNLWNDENRANDTTWGEVCVIRPARHDVGTEAILAPLGVVDSGTLHLPRAIIHNYGTRSDSFPVTFEIEGGYSTTARRTLLPGQTDTVDFLPFWRAQPLGSLAVHCFTALASDTNRANDTAYTSVTVVVPEIHDVGVAAIIAPVGALDSGAVVTPRALIRNYGTRDESFPVNFSIGTGYEQTVDLELAAGDDTTLAFPDWIAQPVGSHAVTCLTRLATDENRANDTARTTVEVRSLPRNDVGTLAILAPVGTVDSGSAHTPTAAVHNFGNRRATFPVTFTISDGYAQTLTLSLDPDETDTVIFPAWVAALPGTHACTVYTALEADVDRSNDTTAATVAVRALPPPDVGVIHILAPTGFAELGQVIIPRAVVRHWPDTTDAQVTFPVTMTIGSTYRESLVVTLPGGASRTIEFPAWNAGPLGQHEVVCFTQLEPDPNRANDTAHTTVEIITVPRHDVGATAILAPAGTLDSGTVHTPQAVIRNFGTRDETFPVTFRIGDDYTETLLRQLAPGQVDTVRFPLWIAQPLGRHATVCYTALDRDENRSNDTVWSTDSVEVVRRLRPDVGATRIIAPAGRYDSGEVVAPSAVIRNFGNTADSFPVTFAVAGYADTLWTFLTPGQIDTVTFRDWIAQPVGRHLPVCYTALDRDIDRSNDTIFGLDSVEVRTPRRSDVGATAILAPVGVVDSGTVITPRARVRNFGTRNETFPVTMRIGSAYTETLEVALGSGDSATVVFPFWVAGPVDSIVTDCYTALDRDENRSNDTTRSWVRVSRRVRRDVGVELVIAPAGTVDSGTTITPRALIRNHGSVLDSFPVTMRIGTNYTQTRSLSLAPGAQDTVSFPAWTATRVETAPVICFTSLAGDENRANDTARATVTVRALGSLDVGVTAVLAPVGTVDSGTAQTPTAVIRNYGSAVATFPVTFRISDGYVRTVNRSLNPGQTDTVIFPAWVAQSPGAYACTAYTALAGDINRTNDTAAAAVTVNPLRLPDVSARVILAPIDTIELGAVITPLAVVRHIPETLDMDADVRDVVFPVTLLIGTAYRESISVTLPPGGIDTVAFPVWTAQPLGTIPTVCFTHLAGDPVPANDTCRGSATVIAAPVHDVSPVAILAPSGTVNTGTAIFPRAVVVNLGNRTESFPVTLTVGNDYRATSLVEALEPGQYDTVHFTLWQASGTGQQPVVCHTSLANDANRANDTIVGTVSVVNADAEAVTIVAPVGTVDSGLVLTPRAVIRNNGPGAAAFPVTLRIGTAYSGTVYADLAAGQADTFAFPAWVAEPLGQQEAVCHTQLQGDPNPANDSARARVQVLPAARDVGTLAVLSPTGRTSVSAPPWRVRITPRARISNFGPRSEPLVPCRFRIDRYEVRAGGGNETTYVATVYENTLEVAGLEPDETREVSLPDTALGLGLFVVSCSTRLSGDADPTNDRRTTVFVVDDSLGSPEFAIRIYTRAGELIRRLGVTRRPGDPLWITWDGCNDRGERVAPGTYICLISVQSGDGPTSEFRRNILVSRNATEIRLSWRQP